MSEIIKVSETMKVENCLEIIPHYLVLKIGDQTYSTTFGKSIDFTKAVLQISETKNIGKESNLNIKGYFTEGNNHSKLSFRLPFELNFYSSMEQQNILPFNPSEWEAIVCDRCKKHLYCPECNKYCWERKSSS